MCAAVAASPVVTSSIRYRPVVWNDIDRIVRAFDDTWGSWGVTGGKPESWLLSKHFVLHYLEPATCGDVAETADGRFMGVTLSRTVGAPVLFPQASAELERVNAELNATDAGSRGLADTLHWHDIETDMESAIGVNESTQAELELFLVSKDARGHGVGGTLWRRLMAHFADCGVERYYLHTDSSCDVGFYRHKGLDCLAERYAKDHPEDNRLGEDPMDDIFIYAGDVPAVAPETATPRTAAQGADR
ncbi:GNAT family N-acetyltransferase [Bifidobacterium avesanii]|uniref:GNAT family N-acetyltransferase n=1 Tax=Bifidobacterium avesanii TaxID=1798157 RepID=A0A7K3THK1_9BIFI|nr:GNAT family N-acetyltransferase [Bifidobacterium avesanii]KAB8292640.1 GNAT family acetyltransferase [Bifidobacterium avesanii]NEG78532.1 GNAT family N-acetyltransferase [Bifidobacterium avesanii]